MSVMGSGIVKGGGLAASTDLVAIMALRFTLHITLGKKRYYGSSAPNMTLSHT